jgi:hypothetical protein
MHDGPSRKKKKIVTEKVCDDRYTKKTVPEGLSVFVGFRTDLLVSDILYNCRTDCRAGHVSPPLLLGPV